MVGDYFIPGGKPIGSDRNSVNALAYRNLSTGERISSFVTEYYPYTPPAPENWLIAPFGAIPEYLIPTGGHSEPA